MERICIKILLNFAQFMFVLDQIAVSEDILDEYFQCNLAACKGACCVEGDMGAPLQNEETKILKEIYPHIKPYLSKKGKQAITEQGYFVGNEEDGYHTPLVNGRECAYTVFENGIAQCGIEKAYQNGATTFQKPISCHLYPIRIGIWDTLPALYYEQWHICRPGCFSGNQHKISLYIFLRTAIIRKFGNLFYQGLENYARSRSNPPSNTVL